MCGPAKEGNFSASARSRRHVTAAVSQAYYLADVIRDVFVPVSSSVTDRYSIFVEPEPSIAARNCLLAWALVGSPVKKSDENTFVRLFHPL